MKFWLIGGLHVLFLVLFLPPLGHCSYNVYPRLGHGMTQARILGTCNFSYPLSIHCTSSRTIVCPACCQVHPSIQDPKKQRVAHALPFTQHPSGTGTHPIPAHVTTCIRAHVTFFSLRRNVSLVKETSTLFL